LFFFQGQVGRPPKTSGKAAKKAGKARKNINLFSNVLIILAGHSSHKLVGDWAGLAAQ
jgi:hypothetical protein